MNLEGLEVSVDVQERGQIWVMVMKASAINFEAEEPLPSVFQSMEPAKQRYWSKRAFSILEKKLTRTIRNNQNVRRQKAALMNFKLNRKSNLKPV